MAEPRELREMPGCWLVRVGWSGRWKGWNWAAETLRVLFRFRSWQSPAAIGLFRECSDCGVERVWWLAEPVLRGLRAVLMA